MLVIDPVLVSITIADMFVFLSKFLPLFVYPVGLACIFLVLALVLSQWKKWRTLVMVMALLALVVGGNRWVAVGMTRSLEWRYLPPEELPQGQVIVVLGGATGPAEYPRSTVELNSAGDRVVYAVWLYKQGVAPHILLSGGRIDWMDTETSTPATEMAQLMELMGVPQDALWLQNRSRNTYEDALYSSEMLKEKGIQRILLVTSARHMPRSVALFEHQGMQVVPLPTDYSVTQASWEATMHPDLQTFLISLVPTASNLSATSGAMKEYIGMLVYALRGWM